MRIKVLVLLAVLVIAGLSVYYFSGRQRSENIENINKNDELNDYLIYLNEFESKMQPAIEVGELLPFDSLIDMEGEKLELSLKKSVLVVGSPNCPNCENLAFPLVEWARTHRELQFIFLSKGGEERDSFPRAFFAEDQIPSLRLVLDPNRQISESLKAYRVALILFIAEGRVVLKRVVFSTSEWKELGLALEGFVKSDDLTEYLTYELRKGEKPPTITLSGRRLFEEFSRKETLLFFLYGTSPISKEFLKNFLFSSRGIRDFRLIVVFVPFNEEASLKAIEFAQHFGLRELELGLKRSIVKKDAFFSFEEARVMTEKEGKGVLILKDVEGLLDKRWSILVNPILLWFGTEGNLRHLIPYTMTKPEEGKEIERSPAIKFIDTRVREGR